MDFCMSFAAQLMIDEIEKGSSENVVLSPMSISLMLNMLAAGSNGETLDQFLKVLGYKDSEEVNFKSQAIMSLLDQVTVENDDDLTSPPRKRQKKRKSGPVFALANAVWIDHRWSLKPSFQEITSCIYKAFVKNVDLVREVDEVVDEVNSWAEKETKGLIKEFLKPGTKLQPPLCLANALYFKGSWETPFSTGNTRDQDFHLLNGQKIKAPFMTMHKEDHMFGSFDDFKILKMRYNQNKYSDDNNNNNNNNNKKFSMCILLPRAKDRLKDLVHKFNNDSDSAKALYSKYFGLRRKELSKVWIPKMKLSRGFNCIEVLERKGLTLPFDQDSADFTSMVDPNNNNNNVCVGMLLHEAFMEVNEAGTEAAAVSFANMYFGCGAAGSRVRPRSFVADHPFMFMIVEDYSKLVVFTGVVLNPLSKN